jgi:imidazole glycerol phosphate synthase subunit HisF
MGALLGNFSDVEDVGDVIGLCQWHNAEAVDSIYVPF